MLNSSLSELRKARQLLLSEISAYPSPIAGCDEQFNKLLSDRARISNAIKALESSPFVATPCDLQPGSVSESR
ncbi:MAG: hypothetical protein EX271_03035 [Acidimicrobiales bacterium]|nr:hypothetical protein [Hyphomonadaceae bacterium]RZV43869.1 MAG: hypothetical protein EX271_03035 [Acidimicrobiales bacterium]